MGSRNFDRRLHLKSKEVKRYIKSCFSLKKQGGDQIKALEEELFQVENKAAIFGWQSSLKKEQMYCLVKLWKVIKGEEQRLCIGPNSVREREVLEGAFSEEEEERPQRLSFAFYYQCLNVSYNREIANTLAILKDLHFGNAYCREYLVCIETNDSAVVKWINDASHLDSDCGVILNDISSISNHLGISSVLPGPNGTNKVALGLTKKALLLKNDFVWMNDFPLCVSGEVEAKKNC
ncbi:hypothetical protein LWI29_003656 [Acer saccharum]|uniref:Uncharacterized protein n=1 Tax=Acer saccharum TaxID=4024 RepID=A0AA39SCZ5_ACESA|nr:hypothetical protein LWI29_003656 [Acer saccharum]